MATKVDQAQLARDMRRKFAILSAFGRYELLTAAELVERTGIPDITIKRQISKLNDEFKMNIAFERGKGSVGKSGYYAVYDWGIIDKEEFMLQYGWLVK